MTELLVQFLWRFCQCSNLVFYNINVCSWYSCILPFFLSLRFYLILSAPQIIDDSSNPLLTYSHNSHRHATAWHCYLFLTWFSTFWHFVAVLMVYMWMLHVINLYIHPLAWSVLLSSVHIVIQFVIYPPKVKVNGNHYNNSNYTNDQLWPAIQGFSQTWHIHANFQEDILNHEQTFILEKTKFWHGQNLDKNWTSNSMTCPQILLTKLGQNVDKFLSNMKKLWTRKNTLDKSWTTIKILGQIMDNNLTKLSKI